MKGQPEPPIQLCMGQAAHCPRFLNTSVALIGDVGISIGYALLSSHLPLSALQCDRGRLVLLRPPRPSCVAQLVALASRYEAFDSASAPDTATGNLMRHCCLSYCLLICQLLLTLCVLVMPGA